MRKEYNIRIDFEELPGHWLYRYAGSLVSEAALEILKPIQKAIHQVRGDIQEEWRH